MKELIERKISPFLEKSKKEKIWFLAPYILASVLCTRIVELFRLCNKNIIKVIKNLDYLYQASLQTTVFDMFIGILIGIAIITYIKWNHKLHRKNTKPGKEYGASRWGTAEDIRPFIDKDFFNNIILSATEFLTLNPKMKVFAHNRNKHVMVYGGSGSGKTYGVVKPNLLQFNTSYVLTDPKGTLLPETGKGFIRKKYKIKVLDTLDFENSMHYNPFAYIREPKDILTLATTLQTNLKPPDAGTAPDPFFDQAALLWLQATIGLLWYEAPLEEQNMPTLLEILEADDVREDEEDYKNAVDLLFEDLEKKNPRHFAVKQRKKYKKAAGKTAKSILITLGALLSPFDIPEVVELMGYDELELDKLGDEKTILYVIISDTDTTFNFIPAIMFTQAFNVLCYQADKYNNGKLKVPIQFILDEFANIGKIPRFEKLIATIRSRMMSCIIMLQTKSQLKSAYKDDAETIIGNCDTEIFLGGKEKSTLKDLEEAIGDETIDLFNDSESYGTSRSSGKNFNKTGRKLMNMYELNTMGRNKCIVSISGVPPFLSDKYDCSQHPNFHLTADADDKNILDFKKYKESIKKGAYGIKYHTQDIYTAYQIQK